MSVAKQKLDNPCWYSPVHAGMRWNDTVQAVSHTMQSMCLTSCMLSYHGCQLPAIRFALCGTQPGLCHSSAYQRVLANTSMASLNLQPCGCHDSLFLLHYRLRQKW